jgi:hypothetical protein
MSSVKELWRGGKLIAEITIRRKNTKRWFRKQILPSKRCRRCGEADPIVLDFHHPNALHVAMLERVR